MVKINSAPSKIGSRIINPEPAVDVPVMTTLTDDWPAATLPGAADAGVAGAGARSFATRQPYVLGPVAGHSWTDQIVMSSIGSRLMKE